MNKSLIFWLQTLTFEIIRVFLFVFIIFGAYRLFDRLSPINIREELKQDNMSIAVVIGVLIYSISKLLSVL